jgi:hypothetical protein
LLGGSWDWSEKDRPAKEMEFFLRRLKGRSKNQINGRKKGKLYQFSEGPF